MARCVPIYGSCVRTCVGPSFEKAVDVMHLILHHRYTFMELLLFMGGGMALRFVIFRNFFYIYRFIIDIQLSVQKINEERYFLHVYML